MRLLLIKTSSLGDVVHALPALSDALKALPNLQVDWVVEEAYAPVARLHTAVEGVIPVAIRRWRKSPLSGRTRQEWKEFQARLQETHYDLVLDAQGLIKSAWIGLLAHGPRVGLDWQSAREPLASLSYQRKLRVQKELPAIARNRLLMAQALGYELPLNGVTSTEGEIANPPNYGLSPQRLNALINEASTETPRGTPRDTTRNPIRGTPLDSSPDTAPIFCFHSSARPEKCWPEANWIALGKLLTEQSLPLCFPSGNAQEHERASRIAEAIGEAVKAPEPMPLQRLIPRLARARAVVGIDTGLLHLCAALGRPGVGLFMSTDPRKFGALAGANGPAFINLSQEDSRSIAAVNEAMGEVLR